MATLLVVEDDDHHRHSLMETLEAAGYCVIAVAQASTAAALLERHASVDLLITAVNAPVMSGLDLLAWKDSSPRFERIPGIVLAGHRQNLGGYADRYPFLRKPVSFVELLLTVAQQFGTRVGPPVSNRHQGRGEVN